MRTYEVSEQQARAIREAIHKYIELGFRVVFLIPGSKEESRRHVTLSTAFTSAELARLIESGVQEGCGIGLKMGYLHDEASDSKYVFALDFDSPALYEQWRAANPALARTPTQRTATGYHVLFVSPEPWNCAKSKQLDFIGSSWYIAAWPTQHPDGQPYEWLLSPWDTSLVQIRDLEALNIPKEAWEALEWEVEDYGRYDDSDDYEYWGD